VQLSPLRNCIVNRLLRNGAQTVYTFRQHKLCNGIPALTQSALLDEIFCAQAIYTFWQYELCDVFIELSKPVLVEGSGADADAVQATRDTLWVCLDTGLRCVAPSTSFLHPEVDGMLVGIPGRG